MTSIAPHDPNSIAELAAVQGDLSKLSSTQRMQLYGAVCRSVGLNPLTRPFEYIQLNGKLTLYARKDATDQLRSLRHISIGKPDIEYQDECIIVTVSASMPDGRTDYDIGAVGRKDMRGDFPNVLMKAISKAKRRVTLSICGLGMLDESEVESIPSAKSIYVDTSTGEIMDPPALPPPQNGNAAAIRATMIDRIMDMWATAARLSPNAPIDDAHKERVLIMPNDELLEYGKNLKAKLEALPKPEIGLTAAPDEPTDQPAPDVANYEAMRNFSGALNHSTLESDHLAL